MRLTDAQGLVVLVVCTWLGVANAGYGGATCTIPEVGNPGATTVCTADSNGFCLIDHFMVTGPSPPPPGIASITYDGVCICYYGYSGPNCATVDTTTTTTSNRATALAALTLGGLGAYFISQLGTGSAFPQFATGFPNL
uniref:Uncharacterized protein LOC111134986 n=1 Tax=Crassostrea virginica TaxID=6565 RepID=A0A8B8EJR8_CRAVI|nr:uncharacterized protein LOC111134986 [Crassostrea virginica]XP_022340334.1 uncharacterized protein LOC111134986 [Crassostrea virginica]XP_022340335.1 uncharacterized protein LOC111134986 [Crassostrea virginica]